MPTTWVIRRAAGRAGGAPRPDRGWPPVPVSRACGGPPGPGEATRAAAGVGVAGSGAGRPHHGAGLRCGSGLGWRGGLGWPAAGLALALRQRRPARRIRRGLGREAAGLRPGAVLHPRRVQLASESWRRPMVTRHECAPPVRHRSAELAEALQDPAKQFGGRWHQVGVAGSWAGLAAHHGVRRTRGAGWARAAAGAPPGPSREGGTGPRAGGWRVRTGAWLSGAGWPGSGRIYPPGPARPRIRRSRTARDRSATPDPGRIVSRRSRRRQPTAWVSARPRRA